MRWVHLCVSLLSECHEHDARDQHPILADEGEPALLDSEGLPVQRCVSGWPPVGVLSLMTMASCLILHGLTVHMLTHFPSTSPSAKVACVKSRDMHWALVAHRDQRDINLSSLRMLIVADGANPCEWQVCCSGGRPAGEPSLSRSRDVQSGFSFSSLYLS